MTYQQIANVLIPGMRELFQNFTPDPTDFTKPTQYLVNKLLQTNGAPFSPLSTDGFNKKYSIVSLDDDFDAIITCNNRCFTFSIVSNFTYEPNEKTTYFAISPLPKLNMYVYGVKSGNVGPSLSGNELNHLMMATFEQMKIPEIYIYDSAGVACYCDNAIEIKHFSVIRLLANKPTFYSSLRGHFLDPALAHEQIEYLKSNISTDDLNTVMHYMYLVETRNNAPMSDLCNKVNAIIERLLEQLHQDAAFFRYVATPYISFSSTTTSITTRGGKRRTTKRRHRKLHNKNKKHKKKTMHRKLKRRYY